MSELKDVSGKVSDSANPIAMCERAGAHANGSTSSLKHLGSKTSSKAVNIVELLEWAYAREKVHLARTQGLTFDRVRGFSSIASSERIGVAVGSSMNLGFEAPRDAYAVAHVVNGRREAALLREYAMIGHPPDWTPQPAIWWEQGPPIYGKDKRGRRIVVAYTVFARGDLDALVAERRAVYRRWALAVAAVRHILLEDAMLVDHALTPDLPALEPWR